MKTRSPITIGAFELFQIGILSDEEQIALLRLFNSQIKKKEFLDQTLNILISLNCSINSSAGVMMYYHYLIAKGFRLRSSVSQRWSDLEMATQSMDTVFAIAAKGAMRIKNPKYHFARVYTLYLLSTRNDHVDTVAFKKTVQALSQALKSFQTPSILWLKNELIALANNNRIYVPSSILSA